jgi:hypothetical protein
VTSRIAAKRIMSACNEKELNSRRYFVRCKTFILCLEGKTFCRECSRIFRLNGISSENVMLISLKEKPRLGPRPVLQCALLNKDILLLPNTFITTSQLKKLHWQNIQHIVAWP